MIEEMNIPKTFRDLELTVTVEDIDRRFSRAFSDPKMLNHLPKATKENIYPILERKCQP
jgi:alcohol dehydrogenase class IV